MYFSKTHEWIDFSADGSAKTGISDYAQQELGDIVYVELPQVGATLSAEDFMGEIESVKSASDIFAPLGGTVTAVNSELEASPELINSAPYDTWIAIFEGVCEDDARASLMTQEQYKEYIATL